MKTILKMTTYWHVRISPKNKSNVIDYDKLVASITVTGKGFWDNDNKNRIKSETL